MVRPVVAMDFRGLTIMITYLKRLLGVETPLHFLMMVDFTMQLIINLDHVEMDGIQALCIVILEKI